MVGGQKVDVDTIIGFDLEVFVIPIDGGFGIGDEFDLEDQGFSA